MKYSLWKSTVALAAGGFFSLAGATEARADIVLSAPIILSGAACTPACPAGIFQWTYFAGVSQNETVDSTGVVPGAAPVGTTLSNTTKDFFTIIDFAGYILGSEQTPSGWAFETMPTGSTPTNVIPVDSAAVPNLTWYYTGAAALAGPQILGMFSARTTFNSETTGGNYVASATNAGSEAGTQDNKVTQISTPAAITTVPEPASMLLLGTGLLGCVGVLRRRKK